MIQFIGKRFMSTTGFIGLGNMGSSMARNIIKKGHKLSVYDVSSEAIAALEKNGAKACSNPAEVVSQVDCLFTMLPDGSHVESVYKGSGGVFESVKRGTLLVDCSTIDASISKKLASEAQEMGAIFMDAPVSGGVNAAALGTLTFMVGGSENGFKLIHNLLLCMGSRAVYCGRIGSGQAAKICNNMLLAITMIGTAEAMNMGLRLGLDPKLLTDIINSSSGRCWSSEVYNPVPGVLDNVPSSNNYEGGFSSRLMAKDLGLAQDAATRSASPVLLGSLAHQIYRAMAMHGFSNKDFSSVYNFLQEQNKT